MHGAKVSALPLCCAKHEYGQVYNVMWWQGVCTAGAWLRANTWRQKGRAPTSATWRLSCAAHPWDLAATKPIDWAAVILNASPENVVCAFSVLCVLLALLALSLYRTICLQLRW